MKRLLLIVACVLAFSQSAFASFTIKNLAGGYGSADTASTALSGTSVSAGDLVVVWVGWLGDGLTVSCSDGTSTLTASGRNTGVWTGADGQFFYILSSVATGLPTYTFSATGATDIRMVVWVFTPSSPASFDQQIYTAGNPLANSTAVDTGSIADTGSDELVIAGLYAQNDATPLTSVYINGNAADDEGGFGGAFTIYSWSRAITGTVSATATLNSNNEWLASAISFKTAGGGGGGGTLPPNGHLLMGVGK